MSYQWSFVLISMILLSGLIETAVADVNMNTCDTCHSITSRPKLQDCMFCHFAHNNEIMPDSRSFIKIHDKHNRMGYLPMGECRQCHKPSDMVNCSDCHGNHSEEITLDRLCTDCHEGLPTPLGHSVERSQLAAGNHSWMQRCNVCHKGNNLKYADVMVVEIDESLPLCSICHSREYKEMSAGRHGRSSDSCVDCHNPHTTKPPAGADVSIKAPQLNASDVAAFWKKIPVLGNPVFLIVVFFVFLSIVYEQVFATPEKGKKLMADNIRMNANKVHSKALELWLSGNEIETLEKLILEIKNQDVAILGMTMKTDPPKVVLFLDFSLTKIPPEELLRSVSGLNEHIKSANYSEKYEV